MPRDTVYFRRQEREADKVEPAFARAFHGAVRDLRGKVNMSRLERLLGDGQIAMAVAMLEESEVREAMEPVGRAVKTALDRGGELAAQQVREAD